MKAVQLRQPGGLDNLEVTDLPVPGMPGPGEVFVRLRASSLNYHDYLVVTGKMPARDGLIPMTDGAGEVLAVGDGVEEFQVGDKVMSVFFPDWIDGAPRNVPLSQAFEHVPGDGVDGCARQLMVAPATAFTHAPRGYSDAESASLVCAGLAAWRALVVEGRLKAGDIVLVQGTGGVSLFALQIAKAMGATVVATSSSVEKLEQLKVLGADYLINYRSEPNWGAAAHALTGGRGVDHVVEIGGTGTLEQSVAASRVGGHIAMVGQLSGQKGLLPTLEMMGKQLRISWMMVGSRAMQIDMVRAIEVSDIRPILDRTFPLHELANAFRHQESGAHFGKIVIDI
ncbi:zinc-dependent alcohol dehydrogenase family protein [Undibacterium terreum]|uniref:Alcohol dehydrogenase n=1 Tax=Undibacterium terreum TaxID=1224302 RepID=A0A916V0T8_9BURK|nr:NAD(P)-dependent alcohol dehydrogenase [Undibacterium terreum]GGD00488.1 alcohol dehydrogenase [Undibacterium terreum]